MSFNQDDTDWIDNYFKENMADYPKFQISKFLDQKREYQVVVRTNDFDELLEAMKQIKPLVQQIEKTSQNTPTTQTPIVTDSLPKSVACPEHPTETLYLKDGKYGPYYSHKWGDVWCNKKAKEIVK